MNQGMDQKGIDQLKVKIYPEEKKSTYYDTAFAKIKEEEDEEVGNGFVEDRTPQAFKYLMNEIKLLQKVEKDYKGQLKVIEAETE